MQIARAQNGAPLCLDGGAPEIADAPLLPVEVRVADQPVGVLIVKQVGGRVLVRVQELQRNGALARLSVLQNGCAAEQYLALPDALAPQLDPSTLILSLTSPEFFPDGGTPQVAAAIPDSAQALGTLISAGGSLLVIGDPTDPGRGGQLTGLLSFETDSRLRAVSSSPPDMTADGAAGVAGVAGQMFGVRSSGSVGASLAGGQPAAIQANLSGAYLYRLSGDTEIDFGLIPVSAQGSLGAQQGSPLFGVGFRRAPLQAAEAPLRIESPLAGRYRVLYRGVVLREGLLTPGVTLVTDLLYPPLQDVLQIEIRDVSGTNLLSSYAVPFDRRPEARPAGTLNYAIDAGTRDGHPSAGLSASLNLTPSAAVQAGVLVGQTRALQVGARLNTPALALNADASLLTRPTADTGQGGAGPGETQRGRLYLGLSRAQPWGSWTLGGSAEQTRTTSGTGTEAARSTELGLQTAVFLTRPALQVQGKLEQVTLRSAASPTPPVSTLRGEVSVAGSFQLPLAPPTPRRPDIPLTDADWNVRVYASQTTDAGQTSAPVRQGGVSLGLNLRLRDRPDVQVQSGLQNGQPLLAIQRTVQNGGQSLTGTLRFLPVPALSLVTSGPYTASLNLSGGPVPLLAAGLSGTVALTGGPPRLLPGSSRQALLVRVGVPGVRVGIGSTVAVTDSTGQAVLPLSTVLPRSQVALVLDSLPLSTSFSVLSLTVQPMPGALVTVADFTPYLTRTTLRQLPDAVPVGAVARLGDQSFPVQGSRYIQLDAQNGDRITVTWPGGSCTALWSDQEVLECRAP